MKQALTSSESLVEQGNLLTEQGEFKAAISVYLQALQLDINNYLAYYNLGNCLTKQNRLAEAISFYYYAININPNFSWSYHSLGDAFLQQGQFNQAIVYYQRSIKLNTQNPWSYLGLANAFKEQKQNQQAIIYYQLALKIKPDLFWAYFNLGTLWREQGKYQQAVNCYLKALEIDPYFEPCYTILEFIPLAQQQLTQLINSYRQILKQDSCINRAWSNLGDTLTRTNDIKEAINCYQQACYYQTIKFYPQLANSDWQNATQAKPDFIILGEFKCGTTSLYNYLGQHSQVLAAHKKEINFFNFHFDRGLSWYQAHFPNLADGQHFITGEASPTYLAAIDVDQRIYQLFPKVKLIILLRNPVERSISHYYHRVRDGIETNSLEVALNLEIQRIKQATPTQLSYCTGYLGNSMYIYKLKRWLALFPRQNILIISSENLSQNISQTMVNTFKFLNLTPEILSTYPKHNSAQYNSINSNLRNQLFNFFQPYNRQLATLLGCKFN